MSDRQDPYGPHDPYAHDPYAPRQQGQPNHTYDAYGQPVYHDTSQQPYEQQHHGQYDQYGRPVAATPYDPYGGSTGADPQQYQGQQPYQGHQEYGYDAYGGGQTQQPGYPQQYDPYTQPQQQQPYQQQQQQQQEWIPQQASQPPYEQIPYDGQLYQEPVPQRYEEHRPPAQRGPSDGAETTGTPSGSAAPQAAPASPASPSSSTSPSSPAASAPAASSAPDYRTEQFSFIEEPDEDSEDVIDWLKFSESRTERREEAKRRGRSRIVVLSVVLALLVVGGVGYLWWAGMLPGLSGADSGPAAAGAGQKRDVLVVHLRDTKTGNSSTALLVDNETTHKGTTVLLPNSLIVSKDDGTTTTLGKSVKDAGTEPTRESLNTLLGADLKASWRLDTPYLENLVETVGGITLDTDATVPDAKKDGPPVVKQGSAQVLNGQAAVAYATYQAPGEAQPKQLARFGQVMQATLKKVSTDADGATATVKSLLQVLDPPLTEGQLGSSLAQRAELAKAGAYSTTVLSVQADGTLSQTVADTVVKEVLGGTVKKTDPGASARVAIRNASGGKGTGAKAQATLVNGGYTVVDDGTDGTARAASEVTYADAGHQAQAAEVATTLGLPAGAVKQGKGAPNADVTVVLGKDFTG
ncbi:LytR C-terminal domain-containing protein [Streptomyces celluloflavus]|uniref:LCP family protein n=1 Tax=Streptomyces celluloflavus TaxID=58344 RepID=UPI0036D9DD6D